MLTAQELYTTEVQKLPPEERLRLAALILNDLTRTGAVQLDSIEGYSDEWSEEDIRDMALHSVRRAQELYSQEDDLA